MSENINLAKKNSYKFLVTNHKIRNFEFFVTQISNLGLTLDKVEQYWRGSNANFNGDNIKFSEISLTILVDEDLTVIQDIYDYILSLI